MPMRLSDQEIRVLGVLIEKSLAQAGSYPLTLNSLTLGANQLQNRDPVTTLTETNVLEALRGLQHKKLAVQAPPAAGARVNRFAHLVVDAFHWDRREQALMAELMLRGRQTAGELRTRATRMTPLQDVGSVLTILHGLMSAERTFVEELEREPGKSANRFRHLLGTAADEASAPMEARSKPAAAQASDSAPVAGPRSTITSQHGAAGGDGDTLGERVSRLEAALARLTDQVADLSNRRLPIDADDDSTL